MRNPAPTSILLALVLSSWGVWAPRAAAQLLNPGFELPDASGGDPACTTDWSCFNDVFTSASPVSGRTGTQVLKVFGPFQGPGAGAGAQQALPAAPGQVWRGEIWARNASADAIVGNDFGLYVVEFLDLAGNPVSGGVNGVDRFESSHITAATPLDTWTPLSATTAPAPSGTVSVRATILKVAVDGFNPGSIFWDDASLTLDFTDIGAALVGLWDSAAAWGDYDNDGDLDVLLAGYSLGGSSDLRGGTTVSRIYRNDAGAFTNIGAGLPGVWRGSVAWGDYDRDNDLDVLLTGEDLGGTPISRIYRNNGGAFADIGAGLPGVRLSSATWGDYDNDGDLDILLTGATLSGSIARIYRNDAGGFVDLGAGLPGVQSSSAAWGDYDGDGDLDILLAGDLGFPVTRVYRNDGGVFTDLGAGLEGVSDGSVAWGDYDGDGDLDILLTGAMGGGSSTPTSRIYRNDAGTFLDIGAGLVGVRESAAAWGDYDNDGDPDVLLAGDNGSGTRLSRIYRNDGGAFSDIGAGFQGFSQCAAAWGDYDGDGALDVLLTGNSATVPPITRIYRNETDTPNAPPFAPTGLAAQSAPGSVTFSWNAPADDSTPAGGLSYDLRVGTTPGAADVLSAPVDLTSGLRRVARRGDVQALSWTLGPDSASLPSGTTLYWSVQAIDAAFAGSAFAVEQSAVVKGFTDIGAGLGSWNESSVSWGDYDNDGDLDLVLTGYESGFPASRIYANNAGTFTDIGAGLEGVADSFADWGDFDNDGDLDVLLAGLSFDTFAPVSRVYRNDAGVFVEIGAGLEGVQGPSLAWGDYDNDGDLDVLLAGRNAGSAPVARIYRNDAGAFGDIGAGLVGVGDQSAAWGDYDADGDLDVLLAGANASGTRLTRIYRNDAGLFTEIGAGLVDVTLAAAAWGDYDADGDLDILLTGNALGVGPVSRIYRNDAGLFTDIGAGLTGVVLGSAAWGDYDSDGDLDALLTGAAVGIPRGAFLYRNDGGSFALVDAGLVGVRGSSVAWGDFDGDGDLDVVATGDDGGGFALRIYRNDNDVANAAPAAPTGLASSTDVGSVTVSWTGPVGDETPPAGLSYALRAGTTPGGRDLASPEADLSSGLRRVARRGGVQGASWTLDLGPAVPPGSTVYWSVQAIDAGFAGSAFAPEESVSVVVARFADIGAGLPAVTAGSTAWGDYDNDGDLDVLLTGATVGGLVARIYRNDAGVFSDIGAGLQGVWESAASWGDYDNDGDLDVLLAGNASDGVPVRFAAIYRNDAGVFTNIGAGLAGVSSSIATWGDYDNDGDLDVFLAGYSYRPGFSVESILYRNDGGAFAEVAAGLPGVDSGAMDWGDYDEDGDLDVLLSGSGDSGSISRVYRNDGVGFSNVNAGLPGVSNDGAAAWGDYDNDGDLDILLSDAGGLFGNSRIYRNDPAGFTDQGGLAIAGGPGGGHAAWGDADNDGDLDVLVSRGIDGLTRIYRNDAGVFTETDPGLANGPLSPLSWGDYDGDGDLDVLANATIYRQAGGAPNTPPGSPTGLTAQMVFDQVTFSWAAPVAGTTPAGGLSYDLRVGTTPGANNVVAAPADGATGLRRVARRGNVQGLSWTVKSGLGDLPPGPVTLYWTVQAVDAAFAGSPFAAADSFVVSGPTTSVTPMPHSFALGQNRPNPFGPGTTITFALPATAPVTLRIYDGAGRLVRTLLREERAAGVHEVDWRGLDDRGRRVSSGVYFYRLEAGSFVQTRKMILLK